MTTALASSITKAASKQTYYTIRFLVDRELVEDAYRAYSYFRWVDDILDSASGTDAQRTTFLQCQESLLADCPHGRVPRETSPEEQMLVELVRHARQRDRGLHIYLRNMMQVMDFDVKRRGQLTSQVELDAYTRWLASAVTECIHYFIGHDDCSPQESSRYMAVSAAHIIHMLRDTFDDAALGYYNVPREVLVANHMGPLDVNRQPYRAWVKSRIELARAYFDAGKGYFARVENARCRLACFAYIARFEWLLDVIEREGYLLRPQYVERNSASAGLQMAWMTLASLLSRSSTETPTRQAGSPAQSKPWRQSP
jgi:phytoene/squalene synthetase